MPAYQCARCMKKFVDERNITLLCPFCKCRVLPLRGAPINPCRTPLLPTQSAPLPVPLQPRLTYHFISLDEDNFDFWKDYASAMRMIAYNRDFSQDMKYSWGQAVRGFLDALEAFEQTPKSEVWIAVAAFGAISTEDFARAAVNIEMCMTVTTHPDVPFTTHMGIFRSPLRCLKISSLNALRTLPDFRIDEIVDLLEKEWSYLRSARNLSEQFHAFAAKRTLQDCSGAKKLYMVNAPLKKMMEILKKNFETKEVAFDEEDGAVIVGKDRFKLGRGALEKYVWLRTLIFLNAPHHPKLAVDIQALVGVLEERARVEAALDWLDKWA